MKKIDQLEADLKESDEIVRKLRNERNALREMLQEAVQNKALLEIQLRARIAELTGSIKFLKGHTGI